MSRRTLLIILFVSLALNLFLVGGIAGVGLSKFREPAESARTRPPLGMMTAGRALPPDGREAWRRTMREQALAARPKLREARMVRQGAWMGFAAEPFDAAVVRAELARSRSLEAEARAATDARIVDFAATLPAADRAAFGEAMARARGPGGSTGGGSGRGEHPGAGQGRLPDR